MSSVHVFAFITIELIHPEDLFILLLSSITQDFLTGIINKPVHLGHSMSNTKTSIYTHPFIGRPRWLEGFKHIPTHL